MNKTNFIFVNGNIINIKKTSLSVLDHGFQFGYGIFETMRIYDNKIFMLEPHLARLFNSAKKLHITIPYSVDEVKNNIYKYINYIELKDSVLKIILSKGGENNSSLVFIPRDMAYTEDDYQRGFTAKTSLIRRNNTSIITSIKTLNYLDNIVSKNAALEEGYNESLFLDFNHHLCEGSMSNLFFIKDNILYTPDKNCGILPGITRDLIINVLAPQNNLKIIEGEYKLDFLYAADEAFITNSVIEIMPLVKVDQNIIGNGKIGNLTNQIINSYKDYIGENI